MKVSREIVVQISPWRACERPLFAPPLTTLFEKKIHAKWKFRLALPQRWCWPSCCNTYLHKILVPSRRSWHPSKPKILCRFPSFPRTYASDWKRARVILLHRIKFTWSNSLRIVRSRRIIYRRTLVKTGSVYQRWATTCKKSFNIRMIQRWFVLMASFKSSQHICLVVACCELRKGALLFHGHWKHMEIVLRAARCEWRSDKRADFELQPFRVSVAAFRSMWKFIAELSS